MNNTIANFARTLHKFDAGSIAEIILILSHDVKEIKLAMISGTIPDVEAIEDLDATRRMIASARRYLRH